jgi:hypothetical protein
VGVIGELKIGISQQYSVSSEPERVRHESSEPFYYAENGLRQVAVCLINQTFFKDCVRVEVCEMTFCYAEKGFG